MAKAGIGHLILLIRLIVYDKLAPACHYYNDVSPSRYYKCG
jgi:hypothetical protein